jgi:peptidoglycan/xylan/chitin deacetylase (PgdA/CDA1 family)
LFRMRKIMFVFLLLIIVRTLYSQDAKEFSNEIFLEKLNNDTSYNTLKKKIISKYTNVPAGNWGEFDKGVREEIETGGKQIAFTFDACGGKGGDKFDNELIAFLRREKIPATLFVSGKWIDENFTVFSSLAGDTLFEIENHGLNHRPCSVCGEVAYGIKGTADVGKAFDEIEANARKIESLTKHRPEFYRSATDFTDDACVAIARDLAITLISYKVLSGDAVAFTPVSVIEDNVLKKIKPGAIVVMHLNHPEWNTYEAMLKIVPKLRAEGYTFVKLNDSVMKVEKNIKTQHNQ